VLFLGKAPEKIDGMINALCLDLFLVNPNKDKIEVDQAYVVFGKRGCCKPSPKLKQYPLHYISIS
jgi:hypothetical protein